MELFDVICWGVLVFAIGVAFGWFMREQWAMRKVNQMLNDMQETADQVQEDNKVKAILEIHHGHFYMFEEESGKFLAQGETGRELKLALKERFPEKKFFLPPEDCDILGV